MLNPWTPCWHLPRFWVKRCISRNLDFKTARASEACGYHHRQPLPGQGAGAGAAQGRLMAEKGWRSFRDALAKWSVSIGLMSQL